MAELFPYQLVSFLDQEPAIGEPVYGGPNGWYPQIALKRRFRVQGMAEPELLEKIKTYCSSTKPLVINIGKLTKTGRMPVKVLEVEPSDSLIEFHRNFIKLLGQNLISRYPERDGDNYYPHITAEYDGKSVINTELYSDKQITLSRIWLLKDIGSEDSKAYAKFEL
ncbi:MAG: 2'-5' RNA ligase family protein [Candidatus Saccharimonadales bacterium]